MKKLLAVIVIIAIFFGACNKKGFNQDNPRENEPGFVESGTRGLHGYIWYDAPRPPDGFGAGVGFYSAVWPLVDKPLANFQIGLPSTWIIPDNADNTDTPLCPVGTYARDHWDERGPTYGSVFQTVEGGLGYWAGNRFRYGPPKFSMNATADCYNFEIASPGWSFFYSKTALPDDQMGIAQLSNRILVPPDGLTFQGNPDGHFLGYSWMALPFTDAREGPPPTGDQSWTLFLSASNFKGPVAYYIPETWSKVSKDYEFDYGRGLDARPGITGGGAMEINTVPHFEGRDADSVIYVKIPRLQFPVDDQGRTILVQDVIYYSKQALYDPFKSWRDGGNPCSGQFDLNGSWRPELTTGTVRYDQGGIVLSGIDSMMITAIFSGNIFGLQWKENPVCPAGQFPQYFKEEGDVRIAVPASDVPDETGIKSKEFALAGEAEPYTSPDSGAWTDPGPALGPFKVTLADGSLVTYSWYRFVDQPSFQQFNWSDEEKKELQLFIEKIHANWPIDRDFMPPPGMGDLATLDPALILEPPPGMEAGYVPIVTQQER